MSQLIRLVLTCSGFVAFCSASGCAVEVENPGKPSSEKIEAIGPKKGDDVPGDAPVSDRAISPLPNSSPEVFAPCSSTLERKGAGSSGLDGAIVRITETGASSQTAMFVYVLEQSRYINVRDVAFASTGVPAGNYSFVVTRPERESCSVVIQINSSDIEDKIELSVQLND